MLGARSFSHFLNVVERYLPVLHAVSGTPDAKFEILELVSGFWRRNRQFVGIIFDKLMQYQIVDPVDVVSWAFEGNGGGSGLGERSARAGRGERGEGLGTFQWEMMKSAMDKANGRVHKAQGRVVQQTKADDDARAAKHAADASATNGDGDGDGDGMEVDVANVNGALLVLFYFILSNVRRRAGRGERGTAKGQEDACDAGGGPEGGARAGDGGIWDGARGDGWVCERERGRVGEPGLLVGET